MAEIPLSEVERRLVALGDELDLPPAPDLVGGVRARIEAASGPRPELRRAPGRGRAPVIAIAIAYLALAAGAAFAAASLHDDLLDLIGIRGVAIEEVPKLPPASEPERLGLGARTSFREAERRAGFELLTARRGELARPVRIQVRELAGNPVVSFAYGASPSLPALGATNTGLVLTQFRARVDPSFVKKVLVGGEAEEVSVGSAPGYWLGEEHVVAYRDESGRFSEMRRLAGSVLLWQRGAVTLRLEANVSMARALRLARTIG